MKKKKALIIVDVQPVFLNKNNEHVLAPIANIIENGKYDLYVNAMFFAPRKNSIWWKHYKWSVPFKEAYTHPSIQQLIDKKKNVKNVLKKTKSVFKGWSADGLPVSINFGDLFAQWGIYEVNIIGLDTNDCVLATAYEAFDLGYKTYVIEDCVQSSEGNGIHLKALALLRHLEITKKLKDVLK